MITVNIVSGCEGECLVIDSLRVAGPKPWGGGQIVKTFQVDLSDLKRVVRENEEKEA